MIPAPYLEAGVVVLGTMLLLFESFVKINARLLGYLSFGAIVLVFVATFFVASPSVDSRAPLWNFYAADALAIFFKQIALATTAIVLLMMLDFTRAGWTGMPGNTAQAALGEFFAIPLFTCAGLMWMASAIDFIMIFVSLELVTISFYVLVSFTRGNLLSLEAGVKYLVLSALATGFLVYGITWIFGSTGQTSLAKISDIFAHRPFDRGAAAFGAVLVLVALGFKIAAVPFQLWVADVYQGAPSPVTAYLSVGSKAAGFVVLLRVLQPFLLLPHMRELLVVITVLTLIYGNLAALPQTNVKRLLAYSSIAHAGYLLVAVVSFSGRAVTFYLVAYLLMTLLSFAVLIIVSQNSGEALDDFAGLAQRSPFLAFAILVAMASLAGVPFTAGFLGKFLVFDAAIAARQFTLVVVGVITVAAGFYYYFKVVRAVYWEASTSTESIAIAPLTRISIIGMVAAIFVLGVYPVPILNAFR